MDDTEAIKFATGPKEGLKILDRDEKKEMETLRRLLMTMTAFQVRFVEQYCRTASAGQAARLAGSTSVNPEQAGYKLLQIPNIQSAIAIAMKKRIEAVGLDTIEVVQKLREIYDASMAVGKFEAANKACELLLKELERAQAGAPKSKESFEKLGSQDTSKDDLERALSIISKRSRTEGEKNLENLQETRELTP